MTMGSGRTRADARVPAAGTPAHGQWRFNSGMTGCDVPGTSFSIHIFNVFIMF